jgi:hypothetical protein
MGVKRRVYYLMFGINDEVNFNSCIEADISIFIGCATSAPDGSSPRNYSQIFYLSIGSVFSSSSIFQFIYAKWLISIFFILALFSFFARRCHRVRVQRSQWE